MFRTLTKDRLAISTYKMKKNILVYIRMAANKRTNRNIRVLYYIQESNNEYI